MEQADSEGLQLGGLVADALVEIKRLGYSRRSRNRYRATWEQIYARTNLEMKRNALEKISEPSSVQAIPCWQQNKDLLDWLRSL
jgi:hypothetical protein